MEDRFKFRFYDTINNKMIYMDVFLIGGGLEQKLRLKNHIGDWYNYDFDTTIIMQSTGLKDKNGKLVFEGDILRTANGSVNSSVNFHKPTQVKYSNGRFNIPLWLYTDKPNFSHFTEIIGNIYENPELIQNYKDE